MTTYLPAGLIGLILAAILSASMSASSAELNALASVTVLDIYKRMIRKNAPERHYVRASKMATVFWGVYAIAFAQFANHLGSLIEAVNILGSLFYGTILGIFLVAFYFKRVGGNATFAAALVAEVTVLACYFFTPIPYLWFNVIGCLILIGLANALNPFMGGRQPNAEIGDSNHRFLINLMCHPEHDAAGRGAFEMLCEGSPLLLRLHRNCVPICTNGTVYCLMRQ